jgi:hypothetical protein
VVLGGDSLLIGGTHNGSLYPWYRYYYDRHKTIESPLDIDLSCTYDSTARTGQLRIVVRNNSTGAVSGKLHAAITESHIYYVWQGMDSLQHVERTMLPDANGEDINVPVGDSVVRTRDFTINSAWVARNIDFVAFVQKASPRTIFQGAKLALFPEPYLVYQDYAQAWPQPGSDVDLSIGLGNRGSGEAAGVTATLASTDPYVSVTTPGASYDDIGITRVGYPQAPFAIHVDAGCPDGHLATLQLAVDADGFRDTVDVPVLVTTHYGLADDMESGDNGWTHSGAGDQWHQTTHRANSPTKSWYCGTEGGWQYTNDNDAGLVTPYFTPDNGHWLEFRHWYRTEASWDFCVVEVNNGGPVWSVLNVYTGASSNWAAFAQDFAQQVGKTARLRFRFMSDGSVTDEGWYVDDFLVGPPSGIEAGSSVAFGRIGVERNPVRGSAAIRYSLPAGRQGSAAVYDAAGRLVRTLGNVSGAGSLDWDLRADDGSAVRAGSYFVRLASGSETVTGKLLVTR